MTINLPAKLPNYNNEKLCSWLEIDQSSSTVVQKKVLAIPQALFSIFIKAIYHFACALFCGIGYLLSGDVASFKKHMAIVLLDFTDAAAHFMCLFDYQKGTIELQRNELVRIDLWIEKYNDYTFSDLIHLDVPTKKKIILTLNLEYLFEISNLSIDTFFEKLSSIHPDILKSFKLIEFNSSTFASSVLFKELMTEKVKRNAHSVADYKNFTFYDLSKLERDRQTEVLQSLNLEFMLKVPEFLVKLKHYHPQVLNHFKLNQFTEETFANSAFLLLFVDETCQETLHSFYSDTDSFGAYCGENLKALVANKDKPEFRAKILLKDALVKILDKYPDFFERLESINLTVPGREFHMGELLIFSIEDSRLPFIIATKQERADLLKSLESCKYQLKVLTDTISCEDGVVDPEALKAASDSNVAPVEKPFEIIITEPTPTPILNNDVIPALVAAILSPISEESLLMASPQVEKPTEQPPVTPAVVSPKSV